MLISSTKQLHNRKQSKQKCGRLLLWPNLRETTFCGRQVTLSSSPDILGEFNSFLILLAGLKNYWCGEKKHLYIVTQTFTECWSSCN